MPTKPPEHHAAGFVYRQQKRWKDPYYDSPGWRRLKAYVHERDGYRCTQPDCPTLNRGHGGVLVAGHIVAREQGGRNIPANVRTFCVACDNRWHREKGELAAFNAR